MRKIRLTIFSFLKFLCQLSNHFHLLQRKETFDRRFNIGSCQFVFQQLLYQQKSIQHFKFIKNLFFIHFIEKKEKLSSDKLFLNYPLFHFSFEIHFQFEFYFNSTKSFSSIIIIRSLRSIQRFFLFYIQILNKNFFSFQSKYFKKIKFKSIYFHLDQTWKQNATTVAEGHGNGLNQLTSPYGMFIDDDQTILIADWGSNRIVEWKNNSNQSQIVAGGNGNGSRNDQLNGPTSVIIDQQTDSLIICDNGNRRVVRWPRRNGRTGEVLISKIDCWDLQIDNDGYLYVSDQEKHEIRRWKIGENNGTIVAGGNGQGNRLDQLSYPSNIFIDEDHSVYVSDRDNHHVMKWVKGEKEGIVVAGGQGEGNGLNQLSYPHGIIVDQLGSLYVADWNNARVMRWLKGAAEGTIVVGGNRGGQPNQLNEPTDLSFDRANNLYVLDSGNHRVQRFDFDQTEKAEMKI